MDTDENTSEPRKRTSHFTKVNPSLLAWCLAILQTVLLFLLFVKLMFWPPLFAFYYSTLNISPHPDDARSVVQWLASEASLTDLNAALSSGRLSEKELLHYGDVRRILSLLTPLICAAVVVYASIIILFRPSRAILAATPIRGLLFLGTLALCAGLFALWDWKVFFAWLHEPLFGPKSWRFPRDSYSLELFPASFWKMTGASGLAMTSLIFFLARFLANRQQNRKRPATEVGPKTPC